MANIKQVAGMAGLSVSCVSKYLKNPDSVLPASRERIEAAIEALHYSPSTAARSLRTKRSYTVKAVMESITNPFYAEVFENLRSELERYGYTVVLQTCDGKGFREIDFDAFDGVVACFLDREDTLRQIIRLARDKLVLMHWHAADGSVPCVTLDVGHAISLAVRHLLDCGCRRLAYIGGPAGSAVSASKREGFLDCVRRSNAMLSADQILNGSFSFEFGYRAAEKLLATAKLPDGIVCENDVLAAGALRCLAEAGIPVPERVCVAGFDDIPMAGMLVPALTSVALPVGRMCVAAAEQLLQVMERKTAEHQVFQASLVVRKSTATMK